MAERWEAVVGFDGYEVSDEGGVRSWLTRPGLHQVPRRLTACRDRAGYLHVSMNRGGKRVTRFVHQLVLEAFVGPRGEGQITRHLDGRRDNNALINLAWGTPLENAADARAHGTVAIGDRNGARKHRDRMPRGARHGAYTKPHSRVHVTGERNGASKLTDSCVRTIRERRALGETQQSIATAFGVARSIVSRICAGKIWKHVVDSSGGEPVMKRPRRRSTGIVDAILAVPTSTKAEG